MPIGEREMPSDYLSRLSYRNGRDGLNAVCRDFGIDAQAVFHGEAVSMEQVGALCGIDALSLGQHAFRKLPQGRLLYRDEILNPFTAPIELVRVCAGCMEEDLARWDFRMEARPFRRAEWLVAAVRTCPVHDLSLVPIGRGTGRFKKDTSRILAGAARDLSATKGRSVERSASRFETYVLARLQGTRSAEWLDALPLFAAIQTCAMLGLAEMHGSGGRSASLTDGERHHSEAAGFEVAAQGESGIRLLLDRMQAKYRRSGREWGPERILGALYKWLAKPNLDDAFEPLRDIVRNHCVDTLPIKSGRVLFGRAVETRRVHSITSASLVFGISGRNLRGILRSKGLIEDDTELPPDKVTFDAVAAEPVLWDATEVLNVEETLFFLGVPRNSKRAFLESGLLAPWHRGGGERRRLRMFRRSDIIAFAARLRAMGNPSLTSRPELLSLPNAARTTKITSDRIVRALLDGELHRVGVMPDRPAWMAMLVDPKEVVARLRERDTGYRSMLELASQIGVSAKVMTALVKVGALQPIMVDHPFLARSTPFVTDAELARFTATYVKLGDLARRMRSSGRALRPRLSAAGIEPAFAYDDIGLFLYRWEDVRRSTDFS